MAQIDLGKDVYPSAFLSKEAGFPDLPEGWEGDLTFHVKVSHVDEFGAQLDLMTMSKPAGVGTVKETPDRMKDWDAAQEEEE